MRKKGIQGFCRNGGFLDLNRKLLERKAREQLQEMDITPEEKLVAFESFMEKIDLYLIMEENERLA